MALNETASEPPRSSWRTAIALISSRSVTLRRAAVDPGTVTPYNGYVVQRCMAARRALATAGSNITIRFFDLIRSKRARVSLPIDDRCRFDALLGHKYALVV